MKIIHNILLVVFLLILILLVPIHFEFWISLAILIANLIVVLVVFRKTNEEYDTFAETEKYRVFLPKVQVTIALLLVDFDIVYYSDLNQTINHFILSIYEFASYFSILVIGFSLLLSVKMKKIVLVQFFHVIVIPIFFFIVMSLPCEIIVKTIIAIVGVYSMFQGIMTDKEIIKKIKYNFNKYH